MSKELNQLLSDIKNHLEYQKMMGVTALPKGKKVTAKKTAAKTDKKALLEGLLGEIGDCKRCKLCKGRTNIVFGVGNPAAELVFVGEGPGAEEDKQGIPFVGRAGQLLTKIIEAMNMSRDDIYIANVVKCRPPENRNPEPDEIAACSQFLMKQIEIISPKVIVCLGTFAAQKFLNTEEKITALRGHFREVAGVKVMPTYHPAFLLRNPSMKKPVWEDMKLVMEELKS